MASDEIVWSIINHQFCSYKLKLPGSHTHRRAQKQVFCRNEHNVTGLCNRQSCPLANSRYATVRADPVSGRLYLYIKTVERAHLPNRWWERIRLSANYAAALDQLDERLRFWPKFLVHKCKQRLTRLTQVRVRARKLAREEERIGETQVARLAPKVRRREETRERKAEAAAKIERAIERELVERLRSGAYGDRPLNVEEGVWRKVMRGLERSQEGELDEDLDDGIEEEEEEGDGVEREYEYEDEAGEVEFVSDVEESDEEEDMEDFDDWLGGESADGSGDEDEDEDEDDDEGDEEDGDAAALKKKLDSMKRKRSGGPPPKSSKTASKRAKTAIEYEQVPAPQQQTMVSTK